MNLNFQLQPQKPHPQIQPRQGYTLTYIPPLQSLLLFGGTFSRTSQIYLYNLLTKTWSLQKTSNPKPIPRKYHTVYYEKDIKGIIVYGGQAEKKRSLDCFDVLFVEDWKWKKLLMKGSIPVARQSHTFTPIPTSNSTTSYLIYGGISLPYKTILSDLWLIKNITNLKDTKTLQIVGCSCIEIIGKGQIPTGRYGHNAYYYDQWYYVYGGQNENIGEGFVVYGLNMRNMGWRRMEVGGIGGALVGFSTLTTQNPSQILILGGLSLLPTSSSKPHKANLHPEPPYTTSYNKDIFLLNLPQQKLKKQPPSSFPQSSQIQGICQLPFQQLPAICHKSSQSGSPPHLYHILPLSSPSPLPPPTNPSLNIQQYLKTIKNQQLLSQQLLHKISILQVLYRQINSYISKLYKQYQDKDQYNGKIEEEKRLQIQACLELKEKYMQIQEIYENNGELLRKYRDQLVGINAEFQGCMETERDQDQ